MHEVYDDLVAHWEISDKRRLPIAIDLICPLCSRTVTFTLKWGSKNNTLMFTSSRCPACSHQVVFILVEFQEIESGGDIKGRLYAYPSPKIRYPLDEITEIEEFSDNLQSAYMSAINVYNVGEWTAAAVLSRRVLEGVAKSLIPEGEQQGNLYQQLRSLPKYRDLEAPILTLADAIRKGGNLGAHFDLEKEPDEETVTLMINLLDDLIEYLFILPTKINKLDDAIENLGSNQVV